MLDEAILVVAYAAFSAGLDRARWWRLAHPVWAPRRAGPLPGGDPVAARARRHRQLATRRASGSDFATGGSFPTAGRPAVAGALSVRGLRPARGDDVLRATTTCPRWGIYLGILPLVALLVLWIPPWPSRLARPGSPDLVRDRDCSACCWLWAPTPRSSICSTPSRSTGTSDCRVAT